MDYSRTKCSLFLVVGIAIGLLISTIVHVAAASPENEPVGALDQELASIIPSAEKALRQDIKELKDSFDSLVFTMTDSRSESSKDYKVPERIPIAPSPLIKLQESIDDFIAELNTTRKSVDSIRSVREQLNSLKEKEPLFLRDIWKYDYSSAKDELLLMTFSEVLEKCGRPKRITVKYGDQFRWEYPDTFIYFGAGHVIKTSMVTNLWK